MLAPLWTLGFFQNPIELSLLRGMPLAGQVPYVSCSDTTLESREPDRNLGGPSFLFGGTGRSILVRFGDLQRVFGGDVVIQSAKLVLTCSTDDRGAVRFINRVKVPWGEGASSTIPGSPYFSMTGGSPRSATWKDRRTGLDKISWQQAGAMGAADSEPISGANSAYVGDTLEITGIESVVQQMADRWYDNHGFMLQFTGPAEFYSSQAGANRPRLEVKFIPKPISGPDLSVIAIRQVAPRSGPMGWPFDGPIEYRATVKNVGDAPSEPFRVRWVVGERVGSAAEIGKSLAPGESTEIPFAKPYKNLHDDHRRQPLMLRIEPNRPESNANNDALEIQENARPVRVSISPELAKGLDEGSLAGSKSVDDWVQAQFRTVNDTILAESRFSFAPDGALERFRVQETAVEADAQKADDALNLRIEGAPLNRSGFDDRIIRGLLAEVQIPDLTHVNTGVTNQALLLDTEPVARASSDQFPSWLGGGDTRNDSMLPAMSPKYYEAFPDVLLDTMRIEAHILLHATAVGMLNKNLAGTSPLPLPMPSNVLLQICDRNGNRIAGAKVDAFLVDGGKASPIPAFSCTADANGLASVPKTEWAAALADRPAQKLFLVRVSLGLGHDWTVLKVWQVADAVLRGQSAIASVQLRVNFSTAPADLKTNIFANKIVTASSGENPSLAKLVDSDPTTIADLPETENSYVELDLGRDRTLREIRMVVPTDSPMWQKFDIRVWGTGQRPEDGAIWTKERNFAWTRKNRQDWGDLKGSERWLSYYGSPQRIRFVRITSVSGGPGKIAELIGVPVLIETGP